jgi:hypothetical protein
MTDRALARLEPGARSSIWPTLRLSLEFFLLFLIALWIANFLVAGTEGAYPNPLWLPVLALSLQYGLGVGIVAALSACALQYTIFAPTQGLTEDIYDYVARATAEPIVWTCVALLIGYIRHAQIRQRSQLQAELTERNNECVTVAELCENLRKRAEMLERHIAVNLPASHIDTAEAIAGLHSANWENFAERLMRFVNLMLGSSEFALYLLRGDILKLVFLPPDIDTPPTGSSIASDDPVFEAVVGQRRTLKASGADVVGGRGFLFGPIIEPNQNRIIGMLAVGDAAIAGIPEDIERCFVLVTSELSRFLGRVILIEPPPGAEQSAPEAGHQSSSLPSHVASDRDGTCNRRLDVPERHEPPTGESLWNERQKPSR